MIMNMSLKKKKKKTDKKPDKRNHLKKVNQLIKKEETDMNVELFQKHFHFSKPIALLRELYRMKNKK